MVSAFTSRKFRFWSFVSMFLLVFVHGYNLELRYLQPWTTPDEPLTITGFIEYFLANGILRFRIPMLFIISGYLYAMNDTRPNKERMGKRLRTLLVPYLLWSAIGIALTYAMEMFPYTRHLIEDSHVVQIDNTRTLIHEYHWYEVLGRWLFFPVAYQLWFIRVLLVYNLAYPFIRWCILNPKSRLIFFGIATFLWMLSAGAVLIEGEGLLFFSLGVWIQKTNFNIESPTRWFRPARWGIIFLAAATLKTLLAFHGYEVMGGAVFPILTLLHKLTVVSGLIACWYGLDVWVHRLMERPWFVWMSAFSFMIYALHAPLVAFLINGTFELLHFMSGYRLISFILLPTAVVAFCILTGTLIRNFAPRMYGLLTGGRGFKAA